MLFDGVKIIIKCFVIIKLICLMRHVQFIVHWVYLAVTVFY